jgi:hypothetical protein
MSSLLYAVLIAIILFAIVVFRLVNEDHEKLPELKNGDWIKITYLPPCQNGRGAPNPYIGMEGEVWDFDGETFSLQTETNWLANITLKTCKYDVLFMSEYLSAEDR